MKPFESVMAPHIEAYLVYRKSLGYLSMPAGYGSITSLLTKRAD